MPDHSMIIEQPFAIVPIEAMEDDRLDCPALAVYTSLRSFCDYGKTTGAFPSYAAIGRRAHCSDRTVRNKVKLLIETGWILVDSGKSEGRSNRYTVRYTLNGGRQEMPTPSERDSYRGRQEVPTTDSQFTESHVPVVTDASHPTPSHDMTWEDWRSAFAPAIRENLYTPDGKPPRNHELSRCLSVCKQMMNKGVDPQDILDAICGVRLMVKNKAYGREVTWLSHGKLTMLAFNRAEQQGVRLLEAAAHEYRKHAA